MCEICQAQDRFVALIDEVLRLNLDVRDNFPELDAVIDECKVTEMPNVDRKKGALMMQAFGHFFAREALQYHIIPSMYKKSFKVAFTMNLLRLIHGMSEEEFNRISAPSTQADIIVSLASDLLLNYSVTSIPAANGVDHLDVVSLAGLDSEQENNQQEDNNSKNDSKSEFKNRLNKLLESIHVDKDTPKH
jgi:hypothetical protein